MNQENVILKVVLVRNNQANERQATIARNSLGCFSSKECLLNFIFDELFDDLAICNQTYSSFNIERKSKRHKKFVALDGSDDFKELMRSLKVKNHVKLVVSRVERDVDVAESPVTDALDQVRKLVGELQKSELWELLRSFTSAYSVQLSSEMSNDNPHGVEGTVIHEFVACDACHPGDTHGNIYGKRYKCIVCSNFDLCENCYLANVTVLDHKLDHPMVVIPDSRLYEDQVSPMLGYPLRSPECRWTPMWSSETQLGEFSSALEPFDLLGCVAKSKNYSELEKLVPESEDKFKVLMKLVQDAISIEAVDSEKSSSTPNESSFSASVNSVTIENATDFDLPCGEWILNFMDSKGNNFKSTIFDSEKDLKKGSNISLDLGAMDLSPAHMVHVSQKGSTFDLIGQFGHRIVLDDARFVESYVREPQASGSITLAVIPKGPSLSQILLTNQSNEEFSCEKLSFEITNCFGITVASVAAHKEHSLKPGRTAKFNVVVNNTHLKWPFRVTVSNAVLSGSCELSLKSLNSSVSLSTLQEEESVVSPADDPDSNVSVFNDSSTDSCNALSDDSSNKIIEVDSGEGKVSGSDDDFDLISMTDVDDVGSDYEVLSNVNSYEV